MIHLLRTILASFNRPDQRIQERAEIMADCVEAGKAARERMTDIEQAWREWSDSNHQSAVKLRGYWWFARLDALMEFCDGWRQGR